MIEITDKNLCCGCSACANACPKSCISMIADEKGFLYPFIDKATCVNCGLCDKICPILNKKSIDENKTAYAAYNTDDKTRIVSSSGGLFGCIANEILSRSGIVFGAAYSDDFKAIKHIGIERKEDLSKLYGSKYLQSEIGDSYETVKKILKTGREVLFVGTSCQVSGLKSYLGKDYENLLTIDVICHGVPSPLIWKEYATIKESEFQSKIVGVDFRNKRFGWKKSVLLLLFANGNEYSAVGNRDEYIRGFLTNLYLRESCYQCKFKGNNVLSDISLGDFWGIENVLPDFSDNKGASAVILNTAKGAAVFNDVRHNLVAEQVTYNDVLKGNSALQKSVQKANKSDEFWKIYQTKGLKNAYKTCFKVSFVRKLYNFARRIGGKIKRTIIKKQRRGN